MTAANWPKLLTELMDQANISLQRGNRHEAALEMARASELLFLQSQKAKNYEEKKRFLTRAGQLLEASLALNDGLKKDDPEKVAISVKPYTGRELRFSDIAGLDDVKQTLLQRIIYPWQHPEKSKKYGISTGGGMLFYGPPGTGKTLLARAMAGELGLPFFVIKSSEILSQFYGQSEKQLAELFENARNAPDGSVVFLDEIDALGAKRTEQMNEASRRVINQLLQELDGVAGKSEKLVFLAATNEPWLLDSALLRPPRFCERCFIPIPDVAARRVLFEMSLHDCPLDRGLSMEILSQKSDGLSGADIVNVCERAKLIPFCESIDTGIDRPVTSKDFESAMQNVRPSVDAELLKRFKIWGENRS